MHAPRFLHAFSLLLLLSIAAAPAARAELVLRLASPQAAPGAAVELEGLLVNDTGNLLASPIPATLNGQWTDDQGRNTPARFQLRTSSNAADLPANTFTRMAWTSTVPANAQGLLTLTIQGADDTLLALRVGETPQTAQMAAAPAALADTTHPALPPARQTGAPPAGLSPFETFRNALSPYDPIYFALGRTGGANARFQLSFKYRPFSPTDPANPGFMDNWYIGYTQTSLWDLHSDSIPFVDTTYNPSLFWARDSLWTTADKRWSLGLNAGAEHKSNGKDGDDSRSLNDLYLQPEFSYRFDGGSRLSFQPRFKTYVATDGDMRYQDYLGYVDWKLRWAQDNGLVLSGLYRRGSSGHATQMEAAWPLQRTFLHMNGYLYVQYFQGYGETLLGYQQKSDPQVRIGIALVP
ncbi:phospholipase A [Castellaniella sp.]|uniref:phospholipase A n=1 Tax=Castellaniella sp. TaxID=1955812 RepID=UPI002AFDE2DB|nr:phospholipase A [Castellaniella sp.]